ncbi:hypothetical protein O1M63_41815 [Streptomyces mirabilis]|nr:hypothetical protein [Streptomyces mirabilis]
MTSTDFYSTFAKEGGRVGSGASAAGRAEWRDVRNDVRALPARPVPPPDVPDATTKTCRPPGHDLKT